MTRKTWDSIRSARRDPGDAAVAEGYERARRRFELGAMIRELRQQRGLTQVELAAALRTSQAAVARLELGGADPSLDLIRRLAVALDTSFVVSGDTVTSVPAAPEPRSRRQA